MPKKKKENPFLVFVLIVVPLLALGGSVWAVGWGVRHYLRTSHYFTIKDIQVQGIEDLRYMEMMRRELVGINVFEVDVGELSRKIREKFPTFDSIVVTRVLPSRLFISAKERRPVAVVKKDDYYLLDADGVVVAKATQAEAARFPLIVGLENKLVNLKTGSTCARGVLKKPLALAVVLGEQMPHIRSAVSEQSAFTQLTKIDASAEGNLSFYMGETLQIKVGTEDFERRLRVLPAILKSVSADLGKVKYIDLAPKEPVVAMSEDEKVPSKKKGVT